MTFEGSHSTERTTTATSAEGGVTLHQMSRQEEIKFLEGKLKIPPKQPGVQRVISDEQKKIVLRLDYLMRQEGLPTAIQLVTQRNALFRSDVDTWREQLGDQHQPITFRTAGRPASTGNPVDQRTAADASSNPVPPKPRKDAPPENAAHAALREELRALEQEINIAPHTGDSTRRTISELDKRRILRMVRIVHEIGERGDVGKMHLRYSLSPNQLSEWRKKLGEQLSPITEEPAADEPAGAAAEIALLHELKQLKEQLPPRPMPTDGTYRKFSELEKRRLLRMIYIVRTAEERGSVGEFYKEYKLNAEIVSLWREKYGEQTAPVTEPESRKPDDTLLPDETKLRQELDMLHTLINIGPLKNDGTQRRISDIDKKRFLRMMHITKQIGQRGDLGKLLMRYSLGGDYFAQWKAKFGEQPTPLHDESGDEPDVRASADIPDSPITVDPAELTIIQQLMIRDKVDESILRSPVDMEKVLTECGITRTQYFDLLENCDRMNRSPGDAEVTPEMRPYAQDTSEREQAGTTPIDVRYVHNDGQLTDAQPDTVTVREEDAGLVPDNAAESDDISTSDEQIPEAKSTEENGNPEPDDVVRTDLQETPVTASVSAPVRQAPATPTVIPFVQEINVDSMHLESYSVIQKLMVLDMIRSLLPQKNIEQILSSLNLTHANYEHLEQVDIRIRTMPHDRGIAPPAPEPEHFPTAKAHSRNGHYNGHTSRMHDAPSAHFKRQSARYLNIGHTDMEAGLDLQAILAEADKPEELPNQHLVRDAGIVMAGDEKLQKIWENVQHFALPDMTMLIRGESGTGKEHFPELVHRLRQDNPVIKKLNGHMAVANFASFNSGMIESELFGHVKGAFTGAIGDRVGFFEEAGAGGTIFLDEIGDMPLDQQAKLLRVIETRRIRPVGGGKDNEKEFSRLKIVAATKKDLEQMVLDGTFRDDLYYRLKGSEINLPPLRERGHVHRQRLINHFLARYERDWNQKITMDGDALAHIHNMPYYGNIRELRDHLERAGAVAMRSQNGIHITSGDIKETEEENLIRSIVERKPAEYGETKSYLHDILEVDYPKHARVDGAVLQFRIRYADMAPQAVEMSKLMETIQALFVNFVVKRVSRGNQSHASNYLGLTRGSVRHKLRHDLPVEEREIDTESGPADDAAGTEV